MSVASVDPGDLSGGHIKIGSASHLPRNLGILAGAAALAAAIAGYTAYSNKQEAAKLSELENFRYAFATKCNATGFDGEAPALVKDAYLTSATLQQAVAKQQTALEAGASCEEVLKALRAADFPIPAPTP
jgi:hypothetical protein